jgi:2-polyprenyl-3-methyl-5-hydroxy-6-metoxy-1,4-benzoquinol methylase
MPEQQQTREPQYQRCLELRDARGLTSLGLMSNQTWFDDPRRLLFHLSRYKFVARMLAGCQHVLEVGCADAFGTRIVLQQVARLTAVDFDPIFVEDVCQHMDSRWQFECRQHDMLDGPVSGEFDGAYALDVLEHIRPEDERQFLGHMVQSLGEHGKLVLGMPSIESQQYASPASRSGHVNCKNEEGLRALLQSYFHHVFLFSMNDEVVHTGFGPMAHYRLAIGCGIKETKGQF